VDLLAGVDDPAALEARDLLLAALGKTLQTVKPR